MKRRKVAVGFYKKDGKTRPVTKSAVQLNRKKVVRKPKRFNAIGPSNRVTQVAKSEFNLLKKYSRRIVLAGSIRRRKPNPSDIDFVIIPKNAKAKAAIYEHASKYKIRARGEQLLSYWRLPGKKCQVDIYFAEPEYLGAMIMFATGPGEYNIALRAKAIGQRFKLNQYGVWKGNRRVGKATTEREVYDALMYPYKSPELRGLSDKEAEKRFGVKPGQRMLRQSRGTPRKTEEELSTMSYDELLRLLKGRNRKGDSAGCRQVLDVVKRRFGKIKKREGWRKRYREKLFRVGGSFTTPDGFEERLVKRIRAGNQRADIWQVEDKKGRPLYVTKIYRGAGEPEEICPDLSSLSKSETRAQKWLK